MSGWKISGWVGDLAALEDMFRSVRPSALAATRVGLRRTSIRPRWRRIVFAANLPRCTCIVLIVHLLMGCPITHSRSMAEQWS